MKRRSSLAVLAGALAVAAVAPAGAGAAPAHEIRLSTKSLPSLSEGAYELWVVRGSRKVSAGTFEPGRTARLRSRLDPATADQLVVTIEPTPDRDRRPSGVVVLAGEATRNAARLRFPVNLRRAAGSFVLATPTDSDRSNEAAGVWFLDTAGPRASLTLPRLPGGWVWEGWAVTQGTPLSTGRFTRPDRPDRSSQFSGPLAAPPFPGEDFVSNLPDGIRSPVNLADGSSMIVLTIEPDIRRKDPTGAGPFDVKPLSAAVPAGTPAETAVPLERGRTAPSGSARY